MNWAELFEYDFWANRQWLNHLQSVGSPEAEMAVLGHLLAAQKTWLVRCQGGELTAMPSVEVSEATMREQTDAWKEIASCEDRLISYKRFNGAPYDNRLSQIAQHVINHGTYHRGELRGMARARGDNDFPETDYIGWVR